MFSSTTRSRRQVGSHARTRCCCIEADEDAGSVIERKKIALTWHYRRAHPDHGVNQASRCRRDLERTVAKKWDVEVVPGKSNVEVRPRFVNKGEIARRLIERFGEEPGEDPEFVLCLGDDTTDEGTCRRPFPTRMAAGHGG